jgi:DNA modification methylase
MILNGDALTQLKTLETESIDLVITSPPYYGLRNYGVENQIGLEKTPQEYISKLMDIFDECKRVLKKTGSCWTNIGDSYDKNKSLVGIPERFCLAMQDNDWVRRNTVVWHKKNCMPSSAKDRFTTDFEYFYFFTKSQKYYFETQYEPIQSDPNKTGWLKTGRGKWNDGKITNQQFRDSEIKQSSAEGRIKRCVWSITTKPFSGAHFAVFPEKLIETPIKACCPPSGIVLDPFFGAGTTGLVAKKLGRFSIGIELNKDYCDIAEKRLMSIL